MIDPDAPAAHVWPHLREAIRSMVAHRTGKVPSRPALGKVRGKTATRDDTNRVATLMHDLDLMEDHEPTELGAKVIAWAMGMHSRCGDQRVKAAIRRMERWARRQGMLAPPTRVPRTKAFQWVDDDGLQQRVVYIVDFS